MTRIPTLFMLEQMNLFAPEEPSPVVIPVVPVYNGRGPRHDPQGQVYDLLGIFNVINRVVFKNRLEPCVLRCARNRWKLTLGLCEVKKRVITLNKVLDDARVPDVVVAQVVHHEMLHLYFGISEGPNGTRRFHTPQFRTAEKIFPGYDEATKWIDANYPLRGRPAKRKRDSEQSFLAYLELMSA
jgi:hypothetical protein